MNNRQSGIKIMIRLIKILKPLAPVMMITISFGVLGFLAAIAITTFGGVAIATKLGIDMGVAFKTSITIIIVCAILRGLLRYIEQYSGHYIAFKILAILRDKVYKALRKLAPSKLESKEKGNLIAVQCHIIVVYGVPVEQLQDFSPIKEGKHFIWTSITKTSSSIKIDMVYHKVDVFG